MAAQKVLVTGGGGFLGKAIVKKLLKNNIEVSSFARSYYTSLDDLGVLQIQGDLSDKAAVEAAVKNIDAVFHVAAKPGLWGPYEDYYKANVIGTENVILACQKYKIGQLIYTSSPSVIFSESDQENIDETVPYPENYLAHYPATKALAEKLVSQAAKNGLPSITIRPHLIWGPEDNHLFPKLIQRAGRLKMIGRKDDLVDTIYVDNAADAHSLAFQKLSENPTLSGNIYFVSQDDPISKWKLVNAFFEIAGKPPIRGHVSARTAFIAGSVFEFVYKLLGIKKDPPMTKFGAAELSASHWFNISKAKKDLGYVPRISTQQGLENLRQWYSSQR
ncbi:MAG: NAD-dependent epimerase/dehydratase family protein [Desulfobacula sp.]|nr:NAD-dependent epimerase/dehydratase family protein [Desulfobacula sp.]